MTHPQHQAPDLVTGDAGQRAPHQIGRFPPVVVRDEQQEAYHAAQGYEPAGKIDPAAWAQAHAAPTPPDYHPQEYPKWVAGVLVNSAAEEEALGDAPQPTPPAQTQNLDSGLLARLKALEAENAALKAQSAAKPKREISDETKAKMAEGRRRAAEARSLQL